MTDNVTNNTLSVGCVAVSSAERQNKAQFNANISNVTPNFIFQKPSSPIENVILAYKEKKIVCLPCAWAFYGFAQVGIMWVFGVIYPNLFYLNETRTLSFKQEFEKTWKWWLLQFCNDRFIYENFNDVVNTLLCPNQFYLSEGETFSIHSCMPYNSTVTENLSFSFAFDCNT